MEKLNWDNFYIVPSFISKLALQGDLDKLEVILSYNNSRIPTHVFNLKVFYSENSHYKKYPNDFPTEYSYDCEEEGLNRAFGAFISHLMNSQKKISIENITPENCPGGVETHYLINFK